jgi:hypothetical protein
MRTGSERERRRIERTARLIERAAELTGPTGGAAVGLLGGPLAALGGSALGVLVQKTVLRLGDEFEQRHLGPREKARAGAALYWALTEINKRLEDGEAPREDGFFDDDARRGRARADELLEAILVRAQRDHEERKVRHLGALYAAIVFNPAISATDADYLIEVASRLTYHQLILLALFHSGLGYRGAPGWQELHPYEWRAHAVAGQLFELCRHGLLARTNGTPVTSYDDANPSHLWVGPTGCMVFHAMGLDRADVEDLEAALAELRTVSELPTPRALIDQIERAVDAERLTEDDLAACRVRIRLSERTRALLPAAGASVHADLRGSPITFRVVHPAGVTEHAQLVCLDGDREEFQAVLDVEEGRTLRVAPLPDGGLCLD